MSSSRVLGWVAVAAGCALVAVYIVGLVRLHQFSAWGVVLGLALALLITGSVALFGSVRERTLRRMFPGAFVSNVAVYPQLQDQLLSASDAFGVDPPKFGLWRFASIVLDESSLRIYAGIRKPGLVYSIPSDLIKGLRIAKAPQGRWILPSFELDLTREQPPLLVDFCLITQRLGIPHAVRRVELETLLASAELAIVMTRPAG
jgi:hypothetical protein